MAGGGDRVLLKWAHRAKALRAVPVDDVATTDICNLLETSALRRAQRGVGPDGSAFKPLSKRYLASKAKRRRSGKFWVKTGESIGKLKHSATVGRRGIHTVIHQVINTPYSGAVHDGATYTRRRRTSSRLADRARLSAIYEARLKRVKSRKRAHEKRLREEYGTRGLRGATKLARQAHALRLKMDAKDRRRRGVYLRDEATRAYMGHRAREAWMVRKGTLDRRKLAMSWVVRIPARPILGVSDQDKIGIGRLLSASAKRRMEHGDG